MSQFEASKIILQDLFMNLEQIWKREKIQDNEFTISSKEFQKFFRIFQVKTSSQSFSNHQNTFSKLQTLKSFTKSFLDKMPICFLSKNS